MANLLQRTLIQLGLAPAAPRARIFISYRRHDSSTGYAGRIADRLVKEFGDHQCFRDVEDIETGTDFVDAIEQAVGSCDALVVVIGPDWLNLRNAAGHRRLDDARDFVRIEVAAALQRNVRVIPVLVGGADMPGAEELPEVLARLAYRQALEMTDTRWDYDVGRLVSALENMGIPRAHAAGTKAQPNYRSRLIAAAIGGVLVIGGAIGGATMAARAFMDQSQNAARQSYPTNSSAKENIADLSSIKGSDPVPPATQRSVDPKQQAPDVKTAAVEESNEQVRAIRDMAMADSVSAEALRTLDGRDLPQYYAGNALVEQGAAIQAMATAGAHAHARIYRRDINGVQINGNQAYISQVLEFSLEFHNAAEQCLSRVPRHDSSQNVLLVRQGARWLIAQEQDLTPTPPVACY